VIWSIWLWAVGLSVAWVGAAFDFPQQVIVGLGVPAIMFLGVGAAGG
jgi:hypothetical protein